MTISYQDQFFKLLLRWKGSLWKTIWKDLCLFLILYYTINAVYRFALNKEQKEAFQNLILLFNDYTSHIPLTFLLGFYVAMVIRRWWEQFQLISWPDHFLFWVSGLVRGKQSDVRVIRRSIARYCLLTCVLAWRSISVRVLKRFPTDDHLINCGLMTEEEYKLYSEITVTVDPHKKWFVPLNWVQTILVKCFEQQRLSHTNELRSLLEELEKFRRGFFQQFMYDWVTIPLVYTQVATIAVYGYFGFCLIARQYPTKNELKVDVDMYFPIFTILQFFFYVGWLKVGEDLMFPFGSDDEDFELNYLLDRHLEMSYLIVDDLHLQMPPLYSDSLEQEIIFPHTIGSIELTDHPQRSHLQKMTIPTREMDLVNDEQLMAKNSRGCAHAMKSVLCIPCNSYAGSSNERHKANEPKPEVTAGFRRSSSVPRGLSGSTVFSSTQNSIQSSVNGPTSLPPIFPRATPINMSVKRDPGQSSGQHQWSRQSSEMNRDYKRKS